MVDQIKTLGVDPETVQYIALTHTHPDHTGAVHHFQLYWSHIKLLASPIGARTLKKTELFRGFQLTDLGIAQLMNAKSEIESLPDPIDAYAFNVDSTIKEGDRIDLEKRLHGPYTRHQAIHPATSLYLRKRKGFWLSATTQDFVFLQKTLSGPSTLIRLTNIVTASESFLLSTPGWPYSAITD